MVLHVSKIVQMQRKKKVGLKKKGGSRKYAVMEVLRVVSMQEEGKKAGLMQEGWLRE